MYQSKDGWMDKNRSAGRNEHLEVKRQRGNGEGVFDSEVLQSSFYPPFFSARQVQRTTQHRAAEPTRSNPPAFSLRNIVQ